MADPANPPAFPRPASIDPTSGTLPDGDRLVDGQPGMTLRDYFAGQALGNMADHHHRFSDVKESTRQDGRPPGAGVLPAGRRDARGPDGERRCRVTLRTCRWLRDRIGDCAIAVAAYTKVWPVAKHVALTCWAALKVVWVPVYRFAVGG